MRLDRNQQRVGYAGAALAAVAFVVLGLDQPVFLAVGLALAALLAFFVWRGSSLPAAAAAVGVSFGPWGRLFFVGSAFIAYGLWLYFTATSERRAKVAAERAVAKAEAEKARKEERPASGGRPAPSKRYTPPAPKKRSGR